MRFGKSSTALTEGREAQMNINRIEKAAFIKKIDKGIKEK
jgi:hypothetical protein